MIAYGAWTAALTFVGAFFIERLGVPQAAAGWMLAAGAAAHLVASTRSGTLVGLVSRRRLAAGSALIMAILLFVLLGLTASAPLGRRHVLSRRPRRRRPVAGVERARPRAAASPPGRDDGGADGRDSARLPAWRGHRRCGDLERRLRGARDRARDRHGRLGIADPRSRRPAGGSPGRFWEARAPSSRGHEAAGPRLGRTRNRVIARAGSCPAEDGALSHSALRERSLRLPSSSGGAAHAAAPRAFRFQGMRDCWAELLHSCDTSGQPSRSLTAGWRRRPTCWARGGCFSAT